ncbi:hypothetical protein M2351_003634 [Azospirillum canadense]|nr:hypothetical protein [Azospirillum canadense]
MWVPVPATSGRDGKRAVLPAGADVAGRVAAVGDSPGGRNDPPAHAPGQSPARTGGACPARGGNNAAARPGNLRCRKGRPDHRLRRRPAPGEPISTTTTDSTVQRLLHRRMGASQPMRWSPRGAHRMRTVRTAVMNGTLASEPAKASAAPTLPNPMPADLFTTQREGSQKPFSRPYPRRRRTACRMDAFQPGRHGARSRRGCARDVPRAMAGPRHARDGVARASSSCWAGAEDWASLTANRTDAGYAACLMPQTSCHVSTARTRSAR